MKYAIWKSLVLATVAAIMALLVTDLVSYFIARVEFLSALSTGIIGSILAGFIIVTLGERI